MTLSNSLLSYQDCLEAMDQALADPKGGRVRFDDEAAALHFRARCHQARVVHRKKNAEIYDKAEALHGASEYDELILRLRQDEDFFYIYLERLSAGSIEVEPLSEVSQITYQPQKLLPKPEPTNVVGEILKRRI